MAMASVTPDKMSFSFRLSNTPTITASCPIQMWLVPDNPSNEYSPRSRSYKSLDYKHFSI